MVTEIVDAVIDAVIGVDTHTDTHTACLVDNAGRELALCTIEASPRGYTALLRWADEHAHGRKLWAVEGTRSRGAGLARVLVAAGQQVIEAGGPPRPNRRPGGKSDPADARLAARQALGKTRHAHPRQDGDREALRILLVAREHAKRHAHRGDQCAQSVAVDRPRPAAGTVAPPINPTADARLRSHACPYPAQPIRAGSTRDTASPRSPRFACWTGARARAGHPGRFRRGGPRGRRSPVLRPLPRRWRRHVLPAVRGLFAGFALGITAGPSLSHSLSRRRWFALSIVLASGSVVALALAPHLVAAVPAGLGVGAGAGMALLAGITLFGTEVGDEVRGRVYAVLQTGARVVLLLAISTCSVLAGVGGTRRLDLAGLNISISGARLLLAAAGVLGIAAGVATLRQIDDRPGVPVVADLIGSLRDRPPPSTTPPTSSHP